MKNVTVTLEETVLSRARVKAASAGKSLSRYMADLVVDDVARQFGAANKPLSRAEAMEEFLAGPKWKILHEGRMPTADERNER
jgi:hypothetical protein